MTSLIKIPFADSGDKTTVPATDAGGGVNMTQGYGQAYSLDPATDPSAKRIERLLMNGLFNLITKAIQEIQASGVAPFITTADNGGSPYSYAKAAIVSLGGVVYQSLTAGNTTTPPGASWSAVPEKIQPLDATLTALASLVGAANKIPYFNGVDTAELTDFTSVGRDIVGKSSIADVLGYLGLLGITTTSAAGYTLNYFKIPVNTPSGVVVKIIQYGTVVTNGTNDAIVGYPIPFPNAYRTVIVSSNYTAGTATVYTAAAGSTSSSITIRCNNSSNIFWLAIGD